MSLLLLPFKLAFYLAIVALLVVAIVKLARHRLPAATA